MHFQHKLKHVSCGLHFIVVSWRENWVEDQDRVWCPECGGTEGFIAWKERHEEEIYRVVPGGARLAELI